jgi:Family of unknown function (DUF6535)
MRDFVASTIEETGLTRTMESSPFMIHLSLFFFFAGLLIYLFNTNHAVFGVVLFRVGGAITYLNTSFMSPARPESLEDIGFWSWKRSLGKATQKLAPEIDCRVLKCTIFNALVEDRELSGFCQTRLLQLENSQGTPTHYPWSGRVETSIGFDWILGTYLVIRLPLRIRQDTATRSSA